MGPSDGKGAVDTVEAAPAKINLALHVTGQREDGYHLLDMLVTFTEAGDVVRIRNADEDSFSISGRFAPELLQSDASNNLVLKARDLLRGHVQKSGFTPAPVAIHLEKNLPVASGIGGGSADAAAALRGLIRHWQHHIDDNALADMALMLGADVPMCLDSQPLIAQGIGEKITLLPQFPQLSLVLVNPLKGVSTPHIFRLLEDKQNAPLPAPLEDQGQFWLSMMDVLRNDLQPPAVKLLPEIGDMLAMLHSAGADVARMSGSGATCFGIFSDWEKAEAAAASLREQKPGWYVQETRTIAGRAS
ncbi:4-(cytidine 5'-diphospho)-2-C-methyl-D-erythritol kinase [Agrobacterium cavarae]|uniref:4-(cytidine 5'-diphospho)-2-C-methyl-D-erythritol kinase n=1 Tax=Agrobacterium cavarae TaxID=2528239 RepID=UPI000DDD6DCF|nr:4-(cytidine 5'-diphospho)-2-C-methyl-D-erythritol kinase [Agrobacterium cavarae]